MSSVNVDGAVTLLFSNQENLMAQERDSFWQLERANRRKTVELVVIFILVYCLTGLAIDLAFHCFHLVSVSSLSTGFSFLNYRLSGFPAFTIVAAVIALAQALRAYFGGSSVLLYAVGAHDLTAESVKAQMVADVVDEMAMAAHIPRPRLCLMEDPAPNAFATGRDPTHSVICVTRGLIDQLDREELQGVIAHEIAHIRGHDTRFAQMAAVMVGGFGLVTAAMLRWAEAQRRGDAVVIPGFGFVLLPVVIFGGIGWLVSKVAAIALSHEREYLADASAVEFTRNPTALIRALGHIARIESPLKASLRGVAPLFIVDPFECGGASREELLDEVAAIEAQADKPQEQREAEIAKLVGKEVASFSPLRGVFSSHPPIQDRIARLKGLLHQPSAAASSEQVEAKRAAAAKLVQRVIQTRPDEIAGAMGSMLSAGPGERLTHALDGDQAIGGSEFSEPPDGEPKYANPADEAAYKKLYEYNLRLTGDNPQSRAADPALSAMSMLADMMGGQPGIVDPGKVDPAQLRAALGSADQDYLRDALAMRMARTQAAVPAANVPDEPPPSAKKHYFFWLVMALSAGAIAAGLAVRWGG